MPFEERGEHTRGSQAWPPSAEALKKLKKKAEQKPNPAEPSDDCEHCSPVCELSKNLGEYGLGKKFFLKPPG